MNKEHEKYMRRCLALAAQGAGAVSPNPLVGCVIVRRGHVVGVGYHRRFGGPHAEIAALRRAGKRARGATLYVNLEPCSHHGKTPPCVDAIIRARVKRVVVGSRDPNPLVGGRGIRKLRNSGVSVKTGILRSESEKLNERFFTYMKSSLPFVGIKLAQTLDSRVADHKGSSQWITSPESRVEAHRIRAQYDAILVGARTVLRDDPQLTVRYVKGRNPLRVVVDPNLRLNPEAKIFLTKEAGTIVFTFAKAMSRRRRVVRRLHSRGVYVLGFGGRGVIDVRLMLRTLAALGVSSVLVEGGPLTIAHFLEQRLAQRLHWFIAPKILGGGSQAITLPSPLTLHEGISFRDVSMRQIGPDFLFEGTLRFR